MTTLRSFQNEIDEIHTKEVAKQRAHSSVLAEKEKENKNPADDLVAVSDSNGKVIAEDDPEDEGNLQVRTQCESTVSVRLNNTIGITGIVTFGERRRQ